MPNPIRDGLDNPHSLSQTKTARIRPSKYDATNRQAALVRVKLPFHKVQTVTWR